MLELILTNRDKMIEGVEVIGTLGENDYFTIMQLHVTKSSQTNVLDHGSPTPGTGPLLGHELLQPGHRSGGQAHAHIPTYSSSE